MCDSCRKDPTESVETLNFRQFVRTLARFKRVPKGHEHEMNTPEKKMDCESTGRFYSICNNQTRHYEFSHLSMCIVIFKVYDTDRDGKISKDDLIHVSHKFQLLKK